MSNFNKIASGFLILRVSPAEGRAERLLPRQLLTFSTHSSVSWPRRSRPTSSRSRRAFRTSRSRGQVTRIRQDAFANKNRIPVEELKPNAERGIYLHPEVFNQPSQKGLYAR